MIVLHNALVNGVASDIVLDGDTIFSVVPLPHSESLPEATQIDCSGLSAFPGLVNMHSHAPMTLFRGLGDDEPLDRWLNDYVWPAEQQLTDELVYEGTLQACHEMMASGTTAFNDMYFRLPSMARAVEASGMIGRLGLNVFGDADELLDSKVVESLSRKSPRISYSVAPHSIYTVSSLGLQRAAEVCYRLGLPMHIHMSETIKEVDDCIAAHGCRPWEYLDRLGILDRLGSNIIAAHCLHLSDNEMRLIGDHHITCVHCPNSNLKLGSGYRFQMLELLQAGARIGLGTDGAASSNNLDMIEVMKTAALLQKGWRSDPTAISAGQILDIASLGHSIARSQPACLFLVRLNSAPMGCHSPLSDLVYATHGECVEMTFVKGCLVYERGKRLASRSES